MSIQAQSASSLARRVAKESSGVAIKIGRTNGQPVLHLIRKQTEKVEAASSTIPATSVEWDNHPWNKQNKPKEASA